MELNEEIKEIFQIVHRRNELQSIRRSVRFKAIRYAKIVKSKQNLMKRKELEKQADPKRNKSIKIQKELEDIRYKLKDGHHNSRSTLYTAIREVESEVSTLMASARNQLEDKNWRLRVDHPKKYDNISLHAIKTKYQKYHAMNEQVKYEIMEHTEQTTKRLRELLRRNHIKTHAPTDGMYFLTYHNKKTGERDRFTKEFIAKVALDNIVHKEVLGG